MLDLNFLNSYLALSASFIINYLLAMNLQKIVDLLSDDSGILARLIGFKDCAKRAKYEFRRLVSMM